MNTMTRGIKLSNIVLPIQVNHGHLNPSQRIDDRGSRVDTLNISIDVQYQNQSTPRPHSMIGVYNYGPLYAMLCESPLKTLTGPLEAILDESMALIEQSLAKQGHSLVWAEVSAKRMGLDVGYPHLRLSRGSKVDARPDGYVRHAGIEQTPIVAVIDHSWCTGEERVEYMPVRHESVEVSFGAWTRSKPIVGDDLSGLYNYAALIHHIRRLQGIRLDGPIEQLADMIQAMLVEDAGSAGVDLASSHVQIKRTGYARCSPLIYTISNL